MLNIDIHAAARAAMYAATEMTDDECKGDYSSTPNVPTLAERREAMYERAAGAEIPSWVIEGRQQWANAVQESVMAAEIDGFFESDDRAYAERYDAAMEIIESETKYEGMRNRLKDKDCGYRPQLVIVSDWRNNVGRRCSYKHNGEFGHRTWEIVTPLRDQEFVSYYLIRNVESGELVLTWDRLLSNLY